MKHKKLLTSLLTLPLLLGGIGSLTACGKGNNNNTSVDYCGDYKVNITAIGSTTIKVSRTIQLRSSVTGTQEKDVTWSSENEEIATVNETGLVTGKGVGETRIVASLNISPSCKAYIKIKVEEASAPTAIELTGAESGIQWVGESKQLRASITPLEASNLITWSSSDETVCSITDNGLVTFLKEGISEVRATSVEDTSVYGSLTFNVKEGVFRSDLGSPYWNVEHQADDEDAYVELPAGTPDGYHSLYMSQVSGQKFYAEATYHVTDITSAWVWQGIGFGSGIDETDTRYFIFSPRVDGQGNNYNKTIVKDLPVDTWPAITTRSQVWGENGLDDIDIRNEDIKIAILRNGLEHYWLINDRVMWYDYSTKYENINTMPIIVTVDVPVKVSNYMATSDEEIINEKLGSPEFNKSFFSSNKEQVNYTDDSSFTFNSTSILNKDHKVRSLGDKAKLVGDFKVNFDVEDLRFNAGHSEGFTGITLNFSRYDSADTVESFMVGKSSEQIDNSNVVARYASWNYQLSMDNPLSIYSSLETTKTVLDNPFAKHHIKVTRTYDEETNKNLFRMWVDDVECEFDYKSNEYVDMYTRYTGAYLIWVGGEYTSCTVSNFEFESNLNK